MQPVATEIVLASSNAGKLKEFTILAQGVPRGTNLKLFLMPEFASLPSFEENAPTFAENAAGKALHYSRFCDKLVFADDSGLVVPALHGAPGVFSARYAGPGASDAQKMQKLREELQGKSGTERNAYFVCAIVLALRGRVRAVVTDRADGEIVMEQRGAGGFGYDPVFYLPLLKKTFAELSAEEKHLHSHRGKAFRRLLATMSPS
ncbi:MAG: XTP/dITP diphosphatase [Candidatus Acidiferrum sp.]